MNIASGYKTAATRYVGRERMTVKKSKQLGRVYNCVLNQNITL